MRLIHVKLEKMRNHLFVKIPDMIAEALHLKEGEEIEISIHSEPTFAQGELWEDISDHVGVSWRHGCLYINWFDILFRQRSL